MASDRRGLTTARLLLASQGATAATRTLAFPTDADTLEPRAFAAMECLGARLGRQPVAIAAPARAARDTAAALAGTVVVEPGLRDCDYGRWAGRCMTDIETHDPEAMAVWLRQPDAAPHGGESLAAMALRLRGWLDTGAAASGRTLIVVSPLVVRILVTTALDLPIETVWRLDVAPCTISRLSAAGGRWRLGTFNAAS